VKNMPIELNSKKVQMSTTETILCPSCGEGISITEALGADIRAHYKKEFQQVLLERNEEIAVLQTTMLKEKDALDQEKKQLEVVINKRLEEKKAFLTQQIKADLLDQTQMEMQDLKSQILEKTQKIAEAQNLELQLRKKTRDIESREQTLELELQRKFDAEKLNIQAETSRRVLDDQQLKIAEKDKQLDDMRRQIEILKRKAEQSSQQAQGEVLEIEIEAILRDGNQKLKIPPLGLVGN
jgi:hypothetical protein